jgi:DNA gyrase subunit A
VVNTHTPVLFFSSTGIVYKLKVYKLPLGTPQARGKAMVNILPLSDGETITTMMPLPEDETTWENLFVMFSTASGGVRRNRLSDFTNVMSNGKIAMKLDDGDKLVRVRTCTEDDDVLLSARGGKVIRFPVDAVRVFSSRNSTGVRGMRLGKDDEVIAMSIVRHVKVEVEQRDLYLQSVGAARRLKGGDYTDRDEDKARDEELAARLEDPLFREMAENEEFILTITDDGMGKRTSAYEYRISGRGGQGVTGIELGRGKKEPAAAIVAAFTVEDEDEIIMVSDGGQIIRCPVDQISIVGRSARGVTVFKVADEERLVSISRLRDLGDEEDDGTEGDGAPASAETEDQNQESEPESDAADETDGAAETGEGEDT